MPDKPVACRADIEMSEPVKPGAKPAKKLLKDSELPVLEWWDHNANEGSVFDTVTVKARREAVWRCPDCDLEFSARILDMVGYPSCPSCSASGRSSGTMNTRA